MKRYLLWLYESPQFEREPRLRSAFAVFVVLMLFLLVSAFVYRDGRQTRMNDQLLRAIDKGDITAVLSSLNAGADPNSSVEPSDNRPFSDWLMDVLAPSSKHSYRTGNSTPALLLCLSPRRLQEGNVPSVLDASTDIVKALLKQGANPNVRDGNGETPLHYAVCTGRLENVRALLQFHADVNARDKSGKTPLTCVLAKKSVLKQSPLHPGQEPEVAMLLEKAGGSE